MGCFTPKSLFAIVAPISVRIVTVGPVRGHLRGARGVGVAQRALRYHFLLSCDNLLTRARCILGCQLPLLVITPCNRTDIVSLGRK